MMWVRFPNGQCIQYNTAGYVSHHASGHWLWPNKKDRESNAGIIAIVPLNCVVEFVHACAVTNPLDKSPSETVVTRELRSIKRKLGKTKRTTQPKRGTM